MRNVLRLVPMGLSVAGVALVTLFYTHVVSANPTTVALSYLLVILVIATRWGIAEATVASILATLTFNLTFLPPVGTLTIADPQNWVSFFAFMTTAIIASQLSGRARQRTIDAVARQQDLERLYALSRSLLLSEPGSATPAAIAQRIASTFDARAVALYDHQTDTISRAGAIDLPEIDNKLREVARQAVSQRDPSGAVITAIRLGGAPIGSLAMLGPEPSDTVLQSIANLAAITLERVAGQQIAARSEAARESSELRATILDAVAHEFKTPLTSMKAATGDLLSSITSRARARAGVDRRRGSGPAAGARERRRADAARGLRRLRGEPRPELHPRRSSRRRSATSCRASTATASSSRCRRTCRSTPTASLLEFALRQLLDNAVKYSPPNSTITISAVRDAAWRSPCTIPDRRFPSGSWPGSSSDSSAAARHAGFPAPGWGSRSCGRWRTRMAGR